VNYIIPLFLSTHIIWMLVHGRWPPHYIDHRDGDTGNDRLGNLREANDSQNSANRRGNSSIRSGLKGAYRNNKSGWYSRIKVGGQDVYLGTYQTKEAAAAAYAEASKKYHGDFGRSA